MRIKTFVQGTAIKFTIIANVDTANEATITIKDTTDTAIVSDADITKEADRVYSYIWQSATTNDDGIYNVIFKFTSGSYTAVSQAQFELIEQE